MGREIRRSRVEVGGRFFLPSFPGDFIHPRWFSRRISEPSTVCFKMNQWAKKQRNGFYLLTWLLD